MRNFFKKFIVFAFFSCIAFAVFAQERNGTVSGDYVIYKDNSFVLDTWVGFLYYDANTYGVVLYTPEAKRRVGILFSVETKDGKMSATGQNIISEIDQRNKQDVEVVNYLMQLLPDMYAWSVDPQSFEKTAVDNSVVRVHEKQFDKVDYFNGKISVHYKSFIPLFYIDSIFGADGRELLKLEKIGRVGPNGDPEFFNFLIPFPKSEESKLILKKKTKNKTVKTNNVQLNLTNQWKTVGDNYFILDNSAIMLVTNLPTGKIKEEFQNDVFSSLIKRLCLSSKNRIVMLDKMQLSGNKNSFTLTNEIYDKKTQTVQVDIKTLIKNADDSHTMISLTVNKADYQKNKSYFDKLY